ncbi:hypothetical protein ACFVT1_27060 [Streptomyces sp. NPDC057963]|uniref:hypothetical protein n=1 Tax=Streptomyces sp. NPDC057963 TaxID=3346290 RepID=UPI0036E38F13
MAIRQERQPALFSNSYEQSHNCVRAGIRSWSDGDSRRLLILLDECDESFEADAPRFDHTEKLKGLGSDVKDRAKLPSPVCTPCGALPNRGAARSDGTSVHGVGAGVEAVEPEAVLRTGISAASRDTE